MEVWALSGPSGTGKSTTALKFAHEHNIHAIIDDGILVFRGNKIAGTSAKFEKTYIAAVKRATFFYKDHLQEVKEKINISYIDKILILGTSERMVNLISSRLGFEKIDFHYRIEDIRSSSEIKMALFIRKTERMHVLPVPHSQIEKSLVKKLISHGKKIFSPKKEFLGENTFVEPRFHKDSLQISEQAFKDVIMAGCKSFKEVKTCQRIIVNTDHLPNIKVFLSINYSPDLNLYNMAYKVRHQISEDFKNYLDLELNNIDIHIAKIHINKKSNRFTI